MILPRLLILTDRHQLPAGRDLASTIASLRGDFAVVLRELDLPWAEREALAADLAKLAPVIAAHESLEASVGTHASASQAAPPGVWGRSCHSVEDVAHATGEGAAWATLGSVAETVSKPGYPPQIGPAELRRATTFAPVFALGGVTTENAQSLMWSGIYGIAVMGAVMRADDPAAVVGQLLEAVA